MPCSKPSETDETEYDNDNAPPEKRRDHRQSAIFTQFRPRPLDHLNYAIPDHRLETSRPPPQRSQTFQPSPDDFINGGEGDMGGSRPQSYLAPRARDSMTMDILEGRQRFDLNAPRGARQDAYEVGPQGSQEDTQEEMEEVDVSRWGLPDHLVAKDDPLAPRPKSSMSSLNPPRPHSSISYSQPIRPSSEMSYTEDPNRPTPVPFPAAHTTSINTPSINRARSVHLDIMSHDSPDEYGADKALETAERIRGAIEANSNGIRERTRSGGDTVSRPDRGSRRVSFNELDLVDRPSTSQGLRSIPRTSGRTPPTSPPSMRPRSAMSRKSSNPLLVPLPASPMHSLMNRHSSYIPPITAEEEELDMLADLEAPILSSEPNPFAMPPPPAVIGSRFDPKQLENQRGASRLSDYPRPSTSMSLQHSSLAQFDNLTQSTTPAAAIEYIEEQDLGDLRVYDDIPTAEQYGKPLQPPKYANARPQRLSRMDLLRPKTLLMPQSLANQPPPPSPPKKKWEIPPEGFSIGEKPLPPGARTSVLTLNGIPRIPMSLSQRTFRSSLLVGGERGEAWLGGADEDGEVGISKKERDDLPPDAYERKAGKLYGKSLIDQLEARKAAMKGRQRNFTGDSRPAMMDRSSFPTALPAGPSTATSPNNARAPLLRFDDDGDLHRSPITPDMPYSASNRRSSHMPTSTSQLLPPTRPIDRMTKSASIFGVDQIWESEMARLRIRQALEAEQAQIVREREEEEERYRQEKQEKKDRKKDRKGKGKAREYDHQSQDMLGNGLGRVPSQSNGALMEDVSPINRIPDLPPMLHFSPEKPPASAAAERQDEGSDSDEDVPLARIKQKTKSRPGSVRPASIRQPQQPSYSSGDDSDIPLSRLRKSKSSLPPSDSKPALTLSTDFAPTLELGDLDTSATGSLGLNLPVPQSASEMTKPTQEEVGEDDDVPLLLRQAHIKSLAPPKMASDDDDDVPLGVRQSMLLGTQPMNGFRPPDPALYAPGPVYGGYPPNPYANSMYGYPPNQWGHAMPMQMHPQMTGMSGWAQYPQQHYPQQSHQMGYPPGYPYQASMGGGLGMNMNMGMGMGQMSFPDLGAMMNAQGQSVPPLISEMGGVQEMGQSENIDSWRKGVDPAVAPPSVGGGSRGS